VVYLFSCVAKNSKVAHEHKEHKGVAPAALYLLADKVGTQTSGWLRPGDLSPVVYNTCHVRRSACRNALLSCLARQVSKSLRIRSSGIFWNVLRRSCGPPTRFVGPTIKSSGLLVGVVESEKSVGIPEHENTSITKSTCKS
jgi:hypothetical protein